MDHQRIVSRLATVNLSTSSSKYINQLLSLRLQVLPPAPPAQSPKEGHVCDVLPQHLGGAEDLLGEKTIQLQRDFGQIASDNFHFTTV